MPKQRAMLLTRCQQMYAWLWSKVEHIYSHTHARTHTHEYLIK